MIKFELKIIMFGYNMLISFIVYYMFNFKMVELVEISYFLFGGLKVRVRNVFWEDLLIELGDDIGYIFIL